MSRCCCRDRSRRSLRFAVPDHGSEDQAREREKGDEVWSSKSLYTAVDVAKDHAWTVYSMANAETARSPSPLRAVRSQRRPGSDRKDGVHITERHLKEHDRRCDETSQRAGLNCIARLTRSGGRIPS